MLYSILPFMRRAETMMGFFGRIFAAAAFLGPALTALNGSNSPRTMHGMAGLMCFMPGSFRRQRRIVSRQQGVQRGAGPQNKKGSDAVAMALLLSRGPKRDGIDRQGDGVSPGPRLTQQRIAFLASSRMDAGLCGLKVRNSGGGQQAEREQHPWRSRGRGPRLAVLREPEAIREVESAAEKRLSLIFDFRLRRFRNTDAAFQCDRRKRRLI